MKDYLIEKGQEDFYKLLKNSACKNGDKPCFNFYKYVGENVEITTLTRKSLLEKSLAVGKVLKEAGACKNDKMIIFSTNTSDNILSMIGTTLCGGTHTLIMPPVDAAKIDRFVSVVKSLRPKFILTVEPLVEKASIVINDLIKKDICRDILEDIKVIDVNKADNSEGFIPAEITAEHVFTIQYTSGSTNEPKGIVTTYGNILSMSNSHKRQAVAKSYGGWLPFCHIFAMYLGVLYPLCVEDTCSNIMSPADFLEDPCRWFKFLSDTKSELAAAPNSIFESYPQMLPVEKFNNIDLSNIKTIIISAEPINYKGVKKFVDEYEELGISMDKICSAYGSSEVTGGLSITNRGITVNGRHKTFSQLSLDADSYLKGRIVLADDNSKNTIQCSSDGNPFYGVTLKIVNPDTLLECNNDEVGEVVAQAPNIASAYYNNEEATRETFQFKLPGYSGEFFRTGDLGFIYDDELYITGRIKELLIINGENILPCDVSAKIKNNIPELYRGLISIFAVSKNNKEQVVVVVGISGSASLNYVEIKDKINACILKYFNFTPYSIRFVNEKDLPKTDSGKIPSFKVKRLYSEDKFKFIDDIVNESINCDEEQTDIEHRLKEILRENSYDNISINTNLLSLGMNSIEVVKLSNMIRNKFNIEVPVKFIFANPTVAKIGEYIEMSLSGEEVALTEDKTYLYNEAVLPEDIVIKKYEEGGLAFKNIFLTGATGFLGAYIIRELIKAGAERIYCHVRCNNEKEGFERIKGNMEYYKLWNDEYSEFIFPVPGQLEQDLLGIERNQYDFLCENIDVIYHNGAVLNFIYPYETLKNINVKGTISTLEMACTGKMKYYNYISSYSVYMNPSHFGKTVLEDDELKDCKGYPLAYTESKWVCEKIIREARAKGLKASIYRPGDITGSVETGIWKYSDMVSRIVKSILKYKTYPQWDKKMYMTTVDYIAEAVVNISKEEKNYNKAYNIINNNYLSIERLADFIKECGYNLKEISYDEFKNHLAQSDMNHPLKPLESLFENDSESFGEKGESISIIYDTSNVQKALEGSGILCPEINADIIKKYIENFK